MKQIIMVFFMIVLGIIIFNLILGDDNSIKDASSNVMVNQIEIQKSIP